MDKKPTYKELKKRIQELETELTQHKKAKDWLKLFSHSFESSPDGLAMGNIEKRITYVNEAFAKMFGYSKEEAIGKEVTSLYIEDQIPLVEEALKSTMKGSWNGELMGKKKDGTRFPVLISSSRVLDEKGNIVSHMASHRDITKQRQIEESMRKSEEKYRTLFENSKDAISIATRNGKYIAYNQSFLDLFGYTEEDMIDMKAEEKYFYPRDRERFKREVEKKGSVTDFDMILKKKDGTVIYALITATLWYAPDKSIVGYQGIIRDITSKKLAEEALRESEEKWRAVFEQSRDAISITARNGKYVDANRAFLDLFGYTQEEIQSSNSIERYAYPEDREKFTKEVEEKGSVKDYELRLRKKNGEEMIALCSSTLRCAPDGSILGYHNMVQDITQKRKILEALRESEAQKQAILDASIDRIRLVDRDMRIIWANRTHERDRNIAPENLIGETCHEVFFGRKRPCPECKTKAAFKSGKIEHTVLIRPLAKNTDERIFIDFYAVPIKNASGDIVHCIQVTRDITEQLETEKALRKSEEKYRNILESIEEGYYELDLAGNLIFFNDSLCKILDYSKDELLGMNNRKLMDAKTSKRTYKTFNKVYKTGKPNNLVGLEIMRKNGKTRTIETSASLMKDMDGHLKGFRGIVRDVTERRQAEARIRKREVELESLNKQLISTNKALSVLAKNLNLTQKQSEKRVIQRIKKYILPIIERIQKGRSIKKIRGDLNLLTEYVNNLASGLGSGTHIDLSLSSAELRVASLIGKGMSSREISKHLFVSLPTVSTHRRNIRKKLDLHHSGMNLKAYLKSEFEKK